MFGLKILIDLCIIKLSRKTENIFVGYCLHCFSKEEILVKHIPNCIAINGKQAAEMPKKVSAITFKNYHKQLPVPFVIYVDLF